MRLLPDQHVTVAVEDAGALPAIVEASDEDAIVLLLTVRDDATSTARLHDRAATLECATPRGVLRVSGRVEREAGRPEVLRLRRDRADVVQRRDAVRVDVVLPVRLTLPFTGRRLMTTTLDLSHTGLRIVEPVPLALDVPLGLEVELEPGSAPIELHGRVTREDGASGKAVAIERISRGDADRLAAYLTERQRLALRLLRRR